MPMYENSVLTGAESIPLASNFLTVSAFIWASLLFSLILHSVQMFTLTICTQSLGLWLVGLENSYLLWVLDNRE